MTFLMCGIASPSSEEQTCQRGREEPASGSSQMEHCPGSQQGDPPLKNTLIIFWIIAFRPFSKVFSALIEQGLPILLRSPGAWVPLTHSPSMLKRKPSLHSKSVPGQPSSQSSHVFLTTSPLASTWLTWSCTKYNYFWVSFQRFVTRKWKLVISPQLRTKQHHFLIQRWCTCCRSLPVKDGPDVFWFSWLSVANKFHKSFGWKHVTS